MSLAPILVALALALATLPLLSAVRRASSGRTRTTALALWGLAAALIALAASRPPRASLEVRSANVRPLETLSGGYVSSDACRACHPGQYDSWFASYHRTMAQVASEESVLAPFDGRELVDLAQRSAGNRTVPFKRGDEFWVEIDDPE